MDPLKSFGSSNFDQLLKLYNNFETKKRENISRIKDLDEENEELRQQLYTLPGNRVTKQKQLNLENQVFRMQYNDVEGRKCLDMQHRILGYSLSEIFWDNEFGVLSTKCYFNESKFYVQFGIAKSNLIDLLEIFPEHMNFVSIQEHFRNTQDTISLLATLRKYFEELLLEKAEEIK